MIPALAVLLLAQGPATWTAYPSSATVGDSVSLTRTLPAPPGVRARPQPLPRTPLVEPLTDPVVEQRGDVLTVRYMVALFEPGDQRIPMPAVDLFYLDGNTETVLGDTAVVRVHSVLPSEDSLPAPRPSLAPLPRPITDRAPVLLLVGLVAVGTGAWALARRRVRPRPAAPEEGAASAGPPLHVWVEAGELRAAAASVAEQLRRTLARLEPAAGVGLPTDAVLAALRLRRPAWPVNEIEELLRALERARFAPAVPSDVLLLQEQAETLVERLAAQPGAPPRASRFEVDPQEGT